jgi:hypothetical protein
MVTGLHYFLWDSMRTLLQAVLALALVASGFATTLERLSVDEMIQKSTSIVRGRVIDVSTVQRGNLIYTVYRLSIVERLKGVSTASTTDVYVPGGAINGYRQTFAGSPVLGTGSDFVVFIWTSPRGINQLIGLGQGLFEVKAGGSGDAILSRGPLDAEMVDSTGRVVTDVGAKLTLSNLRGRVRQEVK